MNYSLVSIVLPIFRQGDQVEGIVRNLESHLVSLALPHETVLVLNGPDDGGDAVCARLADELPSLRLIRLREAGWGEAVRSGIDAARGDLICYTNSARTDPATLRLILDLALRVPGIVIKANRKTRDSVFRHLGSLVFNLECRSLFDLSNFDINGTPKVFPAVFHSLRRLKEPGDLIDAEFLAVCRREGHLILEVPVVVTSRRGGVSTTTLGSAVGMYAGALRLALRLRQRTAER
jgi:glycosyltransferase involved in cell wall biosynthesis